MPITSAEVKEKLDGIMAHLKMIETGSCIERFNTVCMFESNGLTIEMVDNEPSISGKYYATQFEPDTAEIICESVTNGHEEHPIPVSPIVFYKRKIKDTICSLTMLRLFELAEKALNDFKTI